MTADGICFRLSPPILLSPEYKTCNFPVSVMIPGNSKITSNLRASSRVGRICSSRHDVNDSVTSGSSYIPQNSNGNHEEQELKLLWDDGYGTRTAKDYVEAVKDMIHVDEGPPRWFCPVEAGPPLKNSPVLLYIPGIDGLGMGLMLHHKALGMVFDVRCMHVPVYDRTPYEGLVKFVEDAVRAEHALFPNRPVYLLGDSFGGCLALSVAARNPMIDLVLILVNPATSFNKSQLQPVLPFLEAFPEVFHTILPYLFITTIGDPIKMVNVMNVKSLLSSPAKQLEKLILEVSAVSARGSTLVDILSKNILNWKLKLLKIGAASANSRLHAVKGGVLILASEKDSMLPSKFEAQRLKNLLKHCQVRYFKDSGHTLLLEGGINLLSIIKGTCTYRRSKRRDYVKDFLPPSMSEFHQLFHQQLGLFRVATSPVMLSTLADGKIVRGLKGIPDQGPVILVGYHMLFGLELSGIMERFIREKNVLIRGVAHPSLFIDNAEGPVPDIEKYDCLRIFGAVPVTPSNLFRLLSTKSYVLLYPGGAREALHRKGEEYKLFWPDEPEFVRMAIRLGATIVPFGAVGEDDLIELFLDYNDLMRIPFFKEEIKRRNQDGVKVRTRSQMKGEVSDEDLFWPFFYPKLPGRFYTLFGKPVETKGREDLLTNKLKATELYLEMKSEVEQSMAYLIKKREEDPYRSLFDRLFYNTISAPVHQVPTFEP